MMRMTQMFSRIIVICVNGHDRGMATEYGAQIDQVETCLGGGGVGSTQEIHGRQRM